MDQRGGSKSGRFTPRVAVRQKAFRSTTLKERNHSVNKENGPSTKGPFGDRSLNVDPNLAPEENGREGNGPRILRDYNPRRGSLFRKGIQQL